MRWCCLCSPPPGVARRAGGRSTGRLPSRAKNRPPLHSAFAVPVVLRGLYVIVDPNVAGGRDIVKIARTAVEGGARAIQWRDKTREKGLQLPDVEGIAAVCRGARVPLIINDNVDLALAVGAAG